jgi:hypothetical protein
MSNSDQAVATVPVTVTAEKGTEIFIIDHSFDLKAQGLERVSAKLEPGIYKIKFKAGSLIREVLETIQPGTEPVAISSPVMSFTSTAPLKDTRCTHEYHEEEAERLSRKVHSKLGQGSQIFVFARRWSHPPSEGETESLDLNSNPAQGLTLHDLDGKLLLDLELSSQAGSGPDPSAGCTIEVDPGVYRLRIETPRWGALEQSLVASRGWQSQVFLMQSTEAGGVADLSTASVLQAPLDAGFDAKRPDYRLAELARIGLANGRTVISPDDLEEMLNQKSANPMLGVYGAHALLVSRKPDPGLLRRVVDNLEALLGSHPDVEALKLVVPTGGDSGYRHTVPPMLSASWSIVVKAAAKRPELVPEGSLAAVVSPNLWGDATWLIWLADRLDVAPGRQDLSLAEALGRIVGSKSSLNVTNPESSRRRDLSDMEDALLSALVPAQRSVPSDDVPSPLRSAAAAPSEPPSEEQLAEALGVPPSTLKDVSLKLLSKLGEL